MLSLFGAHAAPRMLPQVPWLYIGLDMSILRKASITLVIVVALLAAGLFWLTRGDTAGLSVEDVAGTDPVLEEADAESFPTVKIAKPVGWGDGQKPATAEGLAVNRFAEGLEHPRVLYALPNGDVLVTLTRAPSRPSDEADVGIGDAIYNWIADLLFSEAGAAGESPNQLVLLRDADGDGSAEIQTGVPQPK